MKRFMEKATRSAVLFVAGLATTGILATTAQAQQPTVVLSIRGIESVLDDADFVGDELGHENTKEAAEGLVEQFTGGKGLAGIDQKKPLGVFWTATKDGPPEMPVIFLPVSDADDLKELLTQFAPDLQDTDGKWLATVNGTKLSGVISGGYLFVSPSLPAKLPDPAKISNAKYDIALDVNVAGIPAELKEAFLEQVEAQSAMSQERLPEPNSEAEKFGREWGESTMLAVIKAVVNESDKITLGIDVEEKTRLGAVEFSLTGKPDTSLARTLGAYGKTTPAFAGIGSESAPFRMFVSHPSPANPEQMDAFFASMKTILDETLDNDKRLDSDEEKTAAKDLLGRAMGIFKATAKTGTLHSGLVLEAGGEKARLVGAVKVANGDEAGKLLDDTIKLSKDNPELGKVKLDAAKHAGARIHEVTVDQDEKTEEIFGEEPAHLAFRTDSLWLAMGGENLAALKKALEAKPTTKAGTTPISIQIKPAALIVLMHDDDDEADAVERAKKIVGKPGDKLNIDIAPIANGVKLRIEFGADLLGLGDQGED